MDLSLTIWPWTWPVDEKGFFAQAKECGVTIINYPQRLELWDGTKFNFEIGRLSTIKSYGFKLKVHLWADTKSTPFLNPDLRLASNGLNVCSSESADVLDWFGTAVQRSDIVNYADLFSFGWTITGEMDNGGYQHTPAFTIPDYWRLRTQLMWDAFRTPLIASKKPLCAQIGSLWGSQSGRRCWPLTGGDGLCLADAWIPEPWATGNLFKDSAEACAFSCDLLLGSGRSYLQNEVMWDNPGITTEAIVRAAEICMGRGIVFNLIGNNPSLILANYSAMKRISYTASDSVSVRPKDVAFARYPVIVQTWKSLGGTVDVSRPMRWEW